jgi:hypothetical protein
MSAAATGKARVAAVRAASEAILKELFIGFSSFQWVEHGCEAWPRGLRGGKREKWFSPTKKIFAGLRIVLMRHVLLAVHPFRKALP